MTELKLSNLPIPLEIITKADLIFMNETILKNRTGDSVTFVNTQPNTVYCYLDSALIYQKLVRNHASS